MVSFHGSVSIEINPKSLIGKLSKAQSELCSQIILDCTPYVPFQQGILSGSVHVENGDEIVWPGPYAHYQYMGKSRFTGKPLNYSKEHHPKAGSHWFEEAKQVHLQDWIKVVKEAVK